MRKIEADQLENHRRIPVIRSNLSFGGKSEEHALEAPKMPGTVKKALNIPICDVSVDNDYSKDVSPVFKLPKSYVKHLKKIGDEIDISLDYVVDKADEAWLKGLSLLGIPKDTSRLLSVDTFEIIINILERYTGLSKEPIPQINACKIVADE
mmetsp:Transcript_24261/g.40506  ORF Transcript_24261/g.40506 Transcript_24261/m.40506 type:complete len:152 (-) Transcript_24261:32-487(-)